MTLYKLTDEYGGTRNKTQWGAGIEHTATGSGGGLCSASVIHAYRHPILAALFNPIHAGFNSPQLWEAEGEVLLDDGLKVGCRKVKTLRKIPLPVITQNQRVRFSIYVALLNCTDPCFTAWAENWLSGRDRTKTAAWAAWAEAEAEAEAAAAAAQAAARVNLVEIIERAICDENEYEETQRGEGDSDVTISGA